MLYLLSGAAASGKKTVARHLTARLTNPVAHHENEIPATTSHGRMANMEQWIEPGHLLVGEARVTTEVTVVMEAAGRSALSFKCSDP
jgi:hypothetical protein